MKKIVFVLPFLLCIGGCSEIGKVVSIVTGATVTPQQAIIAANGFDVVEGTALNYDKLPPCGTGPVLCRTASGVKAIDKAVRVGIVARDNIIKAVTAANGQPISASLVTALIDQEGTIQSLIASYGASQ